MQNMGIKRNEGDLESLALTEQETPLLEGEPLEFVARFQVWARPTVVLSVPSGSTNPSNRLLLYLLQGSGSQCTTGTLLLARQTFLSSKAEILRDASFDSLTACYCSKSISLMWDSLAMLDCLGCTITIQFNII